jgi:hypothetical protein
MTGPRRSLLLLRLVAVTHATTAFLQPVLAGSYLSGSSGAIRGHSALAGVVGTIAVVQLLSATIYWRAGGRVWPLVTAAAILTIEGYQMTLGFSRSLALHIPIGVLILLATCAFAIWTFQPAARRPRGRAA